MSTNHTENYNLCQWEESDAVLRTDFNEDNAKLDAALKAQAEALSGKADVSALNSLSSQITSRNCRIVTQTYTGDGSPSKTLTFPGRPMLVVIMGPNSLIAAIQGAAASGGVYYVGGSSTQIRLSWPSRGITLTSPNQDGTHICNYKGDFNRVLALVEV